MKVFDRLPGGDRNDEGPITGRINALVRNRPWSVVLVFVVLTAVFAGGFGAMGEPQAGADQFTEDLPEYEALEQMQEDFDRQTRSSGGTSAQLFITEERNVLSRESLLRMLAFQDRIQDADGLRVQSSTSPATIVARHLDPGAVTPEEHVRAIERATERELDRAVAETADSLSVSADFNPSSRSADVALLAITYDTPPNAGDDVHAQLQYDTVEYADGIEGYEAGENVIVLGDAIVQDEIMQLLTDTSIVVFPAAVALILFFLLVAYRDPLDLALGLTALLMTMIWTFGFMGYARIPFSEAMITVFPLLLAVGIDFGIHIINRYREERLDGAAIGDAMGITTGQLSTAFLIVTITTVFSFVSNLLSAIAQLREFGIVASVGIAFTFLIFGVYLPAGKVGLDRLREGTRIPQLGGKPLGREGSALGGVLSVGTTLARVAPAVVLVAALVIGAAGGAYGTGVSTEFSEEAFFPEQERIDQYQRVLPAAIAPSDYSFMRAMDHLEEDFEMGFVSDVTVYVTDNALRDDRALSHLDAALEEPPDAFESSNRRAEASSIISVMRSVEERDPQFARTVDRYDSSGDGIPDRDVDRVYDELLEHEEALTYMTSDRSATRIQYTVDVDADQADAVAAAQDVADGMALEATATGTLVVNQVMIDRISDSSLTSLVIAFVLTALFLMVSYRTLEGRVIYGVINLVPVCVTVGLLAGSMRLFDIPLSPINAPILGISIGLGVDYTVHFMHRFVDEFEGGRDVHDALSVTVRGTGGALTGSMLTTVCGLGVLYLALIPLIADFGLLLALGVFYAYLASILVLPSTIVVWFALERRFDLGTRLARDGAVPW